MKTFLAFLTLFLLQIHFGLSSPARPRRTIIDPYAYLEKLFQDVDSSSRKIDAENRRAPISNLNAADRREASRFRESENEDLDAFLGELRSAAPNEETSKRAPHHHDTPGEKSDATSSRSADSIGNRRSQEVGGRPGKRMAEKMMASLHEDEQFGDASTDADDGEVTKKAERSSNMNEEDVLGIRRGRKREPSVVQEDRPVGEDVNAGDIENAQEETKERSFVSKFGAPGLKRNSAAQCRVFPQLCAGRPNDFEEADIEGMGSDSTSYRELLAQADGGEQNMPGWRSALNEENDMEDDKLVDIAIDFERSCCFRIT